MTGDGESHREGERRGHKRYGGTNNGRSPRDQQGPGRMPKMSMGGERTREIAAESGTLSGVVEMSCRGWRVESGGEFHMDKVPFQERMWGASDIKRAARGC